MTDFPDIPIPADAAKELQKVARRLTSVTLAQTLAFTRTVVNLIGYLQDILEGEIYRRREKGE